MLDQDSISYAAQLGRLDLVSLLLAAIALVIVVGGVFAFLNLRAVAAREAKEEASRIAKDIAERVANEYIQKELPTIMSEYNNFGKNSTHEYDLVKDIASRVENEVQDKGDRK